MKKATKVKIKKMTKKSVQATRETARVVAADAYAMGRGIMAGVKQGINDAKQLNKSGKRKS